MNLDAQPQNADWIRYRWPMPPYKSKEFMKALEQGGTTLEQFKNTPMYQMAVRNGLIVDDEWVGGGKK